MFSEKDLDIARSIVKCLNLPKTQFCDSDYDDYRTDINKVFPDLDYTLTSGATRLVIIVRDLPFVIKIAFDGTWGWDENDEDIYSSFPCDYNEKEEEMTNLLAENGFGALVPEIEYLCHSNSHSVYVQEKIPYGPFDHCIKMPSDKSMKISKNIRAPFDYCNIVWRAFVIDLYGEQFWTSLVNWDCINAVGLFEDMHGGNYGYDASGRPKFLDVGGYIRQNEEEI